MVRIPDELECVFSASLDQRGDSYTIEVSRAELEEGMLRSGETYRVAILPKPSQTGATVPRDRAGQAPSSGGVERAAQTPPVEEGEVREVTIETLGDQGDGIAKIEHGYVVIVPHTETGDEVTVEITNARENVGFARVCDDETGETAPNDPCGLDESVEDDMLGPSE